MKVLAFRALGSDDVVLVALNRGAETRRLVVQLHNVAPPDSFRHYRSTASERVVDLGTVEPSAAKLALELPPSSISTLVSE